MTNRIWQSVLLLLALALPVAGQDPSTVPAAKPEETWEQRVARLVEELGDQNYFAREAAQSQLMRMGYDAVDALTAAQNHEDLEVAKRATYLLRRLQSKLESELTDLRQNSSRDVVALLQSYESSPEPARRTKLLELSKLANADGMTALCRLVQFERSATLSRQAAILILGQTLPTGPNGDKRIEEWKRSLGRSLRPGADWVRAHFEARDDAEAALTQFQQLTKVEIDALRRSPHLTSSDIVLGLLRYKVGLAERLDKPELARETMYQMIALEGNDSPTLVRLVDHLFANGDFAALDTLAEKFSERINSNARLLYRMAEARVRLGKKAEADKLVARARAINPLDRRIHFLLAYELAQRGLDDWSEQEYQLLVQLGLGTGEYSLTVEADADRIQQLLSDYVSQSTDTRLERIALLSEMRPPESVSALCRVVRFEPSTALAARAAGVVLTHQVDSLAWPSYSQHIDRTIGHGDRRAVKWLRAYLQSIKDPAEGLAQFSQFVKSERELLAGRPGESDRATLLALLRRQYQLLVGLDRKTDAKTLLAEMVKADPGDSRTAASLVEFLLQERQEGLVAQLADKFSHRFDNPLLLFQWSESAHRQGNQKAADEIAQRADELAGQQPEKLEELAGELAGRGLIQSTQRVYRKLIALTPEDSTTNLNAKIRLAAILEERDQLEDAVELVKDAHNVIHEGVISTPPRFQRVPNWLSSRLHSYEAKLAAKKGDRKKELEHLDLALEFDPDDADVVIAMYRATGDDAKRRADVLANIQRLGGQLREQIQTEPENPLPYNQLAWLVANTEGDQDEALKLSLKSLELRPATAGFLDTLAHCYYARKDYANAVKYQAMAVDLDPYSPALSRMLKTFREALAKQREESKPPDGETPPPKTESGADAKPAETPKASG